MPILDRDALKNTTAKPPQFDVWVQQIAQAAQDHGLANLATVTDHHIMPQNQIVALRNTAVDASSEGRLQQALEHARTQQTIANTGDAQNDMEALMSRILWAYANVIPGPMTSARIDDPMHSGGWEEERALNKPYRYAEDLKRYLKATANDPNRDNWRALIDHITPSLGASQEAQASMRKWADAWATHPDYKIYLRLDKIQTRAARQSNDTRPGWGAWIVRDNPRLNAIATDLDWWRKTIEASSGQDKDLALNIMCKQLGSNAKAWLERHAAQ